MNKFEAYLVKGGEMEVTLPDTGDRFLLDSEKGYLFAVEFLDEVSVRYPSMIKAVEQNIKLGNKSLYATMMQNRRMYVNLMTHQICSCCFGEWDEQCDFDGKNFNMEYPKGCRYMKSCPWCGYAERNKDSFMVICGAKREFGFSHQERRVALMVQNGVLKIEAIADVMQVTKSNISNLLFKIYKKTGTSSIAELLNLVKDERI